MSGGGDDVVDTTAEARCLGCGYPLRGLGDTTASRCPECGRAFDPKNPRTMDTPERARRALRRALWWAPAAVYLATFVTLVGVALIVLRWTPVTLVLATAIVAAEFFRRRARRALLAGAPDPARWSERLAVFGTAVIVVYVLMAPGGIRTWSCPHGTGLRVGPLAIAHSTVGGPCRGQLPRQWICRAWRDWDFVASGFDR